jgi:hypothetical protein
MVCVGVWGVEGSVWVLELAAYARMGSAHGCGDMALEGSMGCPAVLINRC